jgi:hypothetical protein
LEHLPPAVPARWPVEAAVAQPDLHERFQRVPQRRQQRCDERLLHTTRPLSQLVDLHRAGFGDVFLLDLGGPGGLVEPRAAAVGTGGESDRPFHERPDVRLHDVDILGQERLLDSRDEPLVGEVHARNLHLGRFLVTEVVALLLGELLDRLVRVELGCREDLHMPAVSGVAGDRKRTLAGRLAVVVQLAEVDVVDRSHALASRGE